MELDVPNAPAGKKGLYYVQFVLCGLQSTLFRTKFGGVATD